MAVKESDEGKKRLKDYILGGQIIPCMAERRDLDSEEYVAPDETIDSGWWCGVELIE